MFPSGPLTCLALVLVGLLPFFQCVKSQTRLNQTVSNDEVQLVAASVDLQRQIEPPPRTRVSYVDIPLNLADLMLASPSMPAGRRRLDSETEIQLADGANQPMSDLSHNDLQLQPEMLLMAAAAMDHGLINRKRLRAQHSGNKYSAIVDNGNADENFPSQQLLTKLSNDKYNRMALASARHNQQALVNKMVGNRRLDQTNRANRRQAGGRQLDSRAAALALRQNEAARRSAVAEAAAAKYHSDAEYDELDDQDNSSRAASESGADEREEVDDYDEAADGRGGALNRRSSTATDDGEDPFFKDATDEQRPVDRESDGMPPNSRENNRLRQAAASRRQLAAQRQATISGRANSNRRASHNRRRPAGKSVRTETPQDIESMNTRQQLMLASLMNAESGANLPLDGKNPTAEAGAGVEPSQVLQYNAARVNFRGVADSDLSASHVRNKATDLQTAAGHHHDHGHGHYYQHVEVPKKKAWKFGFKRGNHKHTIEKHEKGYKNKFHTEFKWHAKEKCKKKSKCKSVGKMTWDYKHHDKKHHGRR